jgi:predicted nucleotidyltransferase
MTETPVSQLPSIEAVRTAAERVGRACGFRLIVLFGSAAREEARPRDLDIAILGDTPLDTVDATNRLIRELGVQPVDVCDLLHAEPLLMALVARDGVPLHEAEPGEFARFASLAARRYADTRKFREMERLQLHDTIARLPDG